MAPAAWWGGLGWLTRSGSSVEALAWALYDFANTIFSFAIVSFAMSLWTIRFLGEGPGTFWFTAAVSVSVLAQRRRLPRARRDERSGRPPQAVPRRLHGACIVGTAAHRPRRHPARAGRLRARQLRLPGGAHLLRRPAAGRRAADRARTPVGDRRRRSATAARSWSACLLLLGSRPTPTAAPPPATFVLVGRPLRASSPARSSCSSASAARSGARSAPPMPSARAASWRRRIAHAREAPGLLRFIVARFFYSDPVNTAIAVMSAFAVYAVGFTEGQALQVLLVLTVVAVIASLRLGLPRRPMGPAAHALRRPRHVGGRPRHPHAVPVDDPVPARRRAARRRAGRGRRGGSAHAAAAHAAGAHRRDVRPLRAGREVQRRHRPVRLRRRSWPACSTASTAAPTRSRSRRCSCCCSVGIADPARRPRGRAGERGGRRRRARSRRWPRDGRRRPPRRFGAGAGEHDGGLPPRRRGRGRCDRARRPPHRRRAAGRHPRRDARPHHRPLRRGRRPDHGRHPPGRCGRALRAARRLRASRSPAGACGSRRSRRCSTGCPTASGWWSRSRRAPPPTPSSPRSRAHAVARRRTAGGDQLRRGRHRAACTSSTRASRPATCWCRPSRSRPALAWAIEHGHTGVLPWDGDLGADPTPDPRAGAAPSGARSAATSSTTRPACSILAACGLWGFVTDVPDVAREALGRRGATS